MVASRALSAFMLLCSACMCSAGLRSPQGSGHLGASDVKTDGTPLVSQNVTESQGVSGLLARYGASMEVTPRQFCTKFCTAGKPAEPVCINQCLASVNPDEFCISICDHSESNSMCVTGCQTEMHACMELIGVRRRNCMQRTSSKYSTPPAFL